jgi:hypothetical protein
MPCGNFLATVRKAVKEENGSQMQYLGATKQCNDFETVLYEVAKFDLSDTLDDFKDNLRGYSIF